MELCRDSKRGYAFVKCASVLWLELAEKAVVTLIALRLRYDIG